MCFDQLDWLVAKNLSAYRNPSFTFFYIKTVFFSSTFLHVTERIGSQQEILDCPALCGVPSIC